MSVVASLCGERPTIGCGEDDLSAGRSVSRTFYIRVDNKQDGPEVVYGATILPKLFDIYSTPTETNSSLICVGRKPIKIGPFDWEVVCDYKVHVTTTTGTGTGDTPETSPNEMDWTMKVALDFEQYEVPLMGNISVEGKPNEISGGLAYVSASNVNGEAFNPPIVAILYWPVLVFTKYTLWVDAYRIQEYVGAVNNFYWFGADPRQFRITGWNTSNLETIQTHNQTVRFYTHTIRISYKRDLWDLSALNQGSWYWDSMSHYEANRRTFLTADGHPYIGMLDLNGMKLADGEDPVFLSHRYYREKNFQVMGLPEEFPVGGIT